MKDRIHPPLWLLIMLLPIGGVLFLMQQPTAPTNLDSVPKDRGEEIVEPAVPEVPETVPEVEPLDPVTPAAVDRIIPELPRILKIRALSYSGELLPAGTVLPIDDVDGPLRTGAGGEVEVQSTDLYWVGTAGERQRIDLPAGTWILDCTFQQSQGGDPQPVALKWVVLAREQQNQLPAQWILCGETPLSAGLRLLVRLYYKDRVLQGSYETTERSSILWTRSLVQDSWFAGQLSIRIEWDANLVSDEVRQQMATVWPAATEGGTWTGEGQMWVDDPQVFRTQQREITRWYAGALAEAEASRDLLLVAGAAARGRRASLLRDPERVDELYEHPLAPVLDRLGRGKAFDFKRWRKLIDEQLPGHWEQWMKEESIPYPQRHPAASRNILLLFQTLQKYSRLESTIVYEELGKPRHKHDFVANVDWGPATERKQMLTRIRNYISSIREELRP